MSIMKTGRRTVVATGAGALALGLGVLVSGGTAHASASSAELYAYNFLNASGTIRNSAVGGATAPMTLSGDWSVVPSGVLFAGDTNGSYSIGHADPGGNTISEAATASVGIGVRFIYQAPTTGGCFGDSLNITQVGRFAANAAQAKIQLTNCNDYRSGEFIQCRYAGSKTPSSVLPVTNSMKLVNGDTYVVSCQKTPDSGSKASVVLSVQDLSASKTANGTFSVAALGAMTTTAALSAGNKYPLPSAGANTDQFQGTITHTVLCGGATADVASCLSSYAGAL